MFPPRSNPQKPSFCNCPRRYSSTWRRSGRSLQSIAEFSSWGSRCERSPPGTPGCRNSERKGCVPSPRAKMGRLQYIVVQLTSWQSCSVSELPVTCLALFRLYSLLPHNLVSLWNITLLMPTNHKMRQGITSMHFKFSPTQHCAPTLDPRFDLDSTILSPFLMKGSKDKNSHICYPQGGGTLRQ